MTINIFIQARMSSSRYPGKVLALLNQKPLIKHLIERMEKVKKKNNVVVLTSTNASDNPLVAYLENIGCLYFRGSLDNVFERFQECLKIYPCDYFVRICADSPFLEPELVGALLEYAQGSRYDVISNVFSGKFPKGQSVEIAKCETFLNIDKNILSDYEREHVMPYFYNHKENFQSLFFDAIEDLSHIKMCVDTLDDLKILGESNYFYFFDKSKLCITA